MSTDLGLAYGEEQLSAERANAKSLFYGSGSDIANISPSSAIALSYCTESGNGFLINHLYIRHYDPEVEAWTGWDDVSRKHAHSDDTETQGGDWYDVWVSNVESNYVKFRPTFGFEEGLLTDIASGGAFSGVFHSSGSNTQYLLLKTGTTDEGWAQLQEGGIALSLNSKVEWHAKWQIDTPDETNVLWRMGVGMETVNDASDTTKQKFGLEGCTGDGVFVMLVASNGISRIKDSTTVGMDQATARGSKITYTPSTSVIYEDSTGIIKVGTGGFPSSGNIETDKTLRYGIRSTVVSHSCELRVWGDALFGKILDPAWI